MGTPNPSSAFYVKLSCIISRSQAPASRDGRRPEAGASGADAFPSRGLGTRKKTSMGTPNPSSAFYVQLSCIISRSQAPAFRDGRRPEAGASGADSFPSRGLGTRKKTSMGTPNPSSAFYVQLSCIISRSQAPASRDGRRPEAGASGADAFPSRGLGTRKKPQWERRTPVRRFMFNYPVLFLVPKPRLGNALAGEAPASRDGRQPEAGASGADAFPSRGLGTRKPQFGVLCSTILYY
jgi:hypothetical protein